VLGRETLPIIEIRSKSGFYDYHAKYVDEGTEYLLSTVDDEGVRACVRRAATACFDALGCRHFARVDFILSDDGVPYALEVNTIPGFTTHSLLPKAAAEVGFSMRDLCVEIVQMAFSERRSSVKR
jgi:D-alanine-D-alanine ligase